MVKVSLSFEVPCVVESAWRQLHSSATIASVYGSIMSMRPVTAIPDTLTSGDRFVVALYAFNLVPVGKQTIAVTDTGRNVDGILVRTMHDRGGPLTGPLALLNNWHHQMSVAPVPSDSSRTRWTDTLTFDGPVAFLFWPVLYVAWQLRATRIKRLARAW